ncbi:MAG: radical SAM protein [Deltaproteobacteria bacterium]|nr:radical SAM protein [Deltaproteobacteria bacterium]
MRKAAFVLTGIKRLFDSRPVHAQVVVTRECNLACGYCHEYTSGAPIVPYEVLARRIDRLGALGAFTIDLLGGEPLLHPEIVALVARIKAIRRGMNFATIITNAFKLTPELVDGFNAAGLDCMQVSVDGIDPEPGLPKSLRSVLPKLQILAERAAFQVKIQTVLSEESWRRYAQFRELLAPFDFEFGFSLLHDGEGRVAIRGEHFAELLRRHELFPGMAFFRRHAAEMLVGDFHRPWKCLGGFKYLYVNPDGRVQYCSQVAGGAPALETLGLDALRAADAHKPCEAGCAIGCVRTVSHAMANPLGSLATSVEILADFMRPRAPAPTPVSTPIRRTGR